MHNTAGLQSKGCSTDMDSSTENRELRLRIFKGQLRIQAQNTSKNVRATGVSSHNHADSAVHWIGVSSLQSSGTREPGIRALDCELISDD